jgi:hypothetical protein
LCSFVWRRRNKSFIAEEDLSSQHHSQQHYPNPYDQYRPIGGDISDNTRTRLSRRGSSLAAPANNFPATPTRQNTSPQPMARCPPMPSNETVNNDRNKAFAQATSKNSRINVPSNDENDCSSQNSPVKRRTSRKRPDPPSPLEDNINSPTKTPRKDKIRAQIRKLVKQTTNKKSVDSYINLGQIMSMLEGRDNFVEKAANDSVLFEYLIGTIMSELPRRLRRIYQRNPTKCPIQIIALVYKYEFVEYKMKKASLDVIKKFVELDRELWAKIDENGNYINKGQRPTEDKGTVIMLAFGTKKTSCYNKGTDNVDKMDSGNSTIRYVKRNIFRDYLFAIGHPCSKDDAERIFDENIGLTDLWDECGLYLEGNDWDGFDYQLLVRYSSFCNEFQNELEIEGVSVIEGTRYYHYNGIHIAALSSALDLAIHARMWNLATNKRFRVFVHTTRGLGLLCGEPEDGRSQYEVRYNDNIVMGGGLHPNAEKFITNLLSTDVKSIDKAYSLACLPIAKIYGNCTLSNSWEQRWMEQKGIEDEANSDSEEINEINAKKVAIILETEEKERKTKEARKEAKVASRNLKKLDKVYARAERSKSEKAQR